MATFHMQVLTRWWYLLRRDVWSKKSVFTTVSIFLLVTAIWWWLSGRDKAIEQAIENLIPGLVAAIVNLIVLFLVKLGEAREAVCNEVNERRRMEALQKSEASQIAFWLGGKLADKYLGIGQAYLFGSVTHDSYQTSDVDVAVMFKKMEDAEYARRERGLSPIVREFERTFSKPLHFQRFLATEADDFHDFISGQSRPVLVLGQATDE